MWSAVSSVLRLLVTGALALVVVAILLGRAVPKDSAGRLVAPEHLVIISRTLADARSWEARYYDPSTGRLGSLKLSSNQALDYASIAPWRGAAGQGQVAGLLTHYLSRNTGRVLGGATLARLSFPGGHVLDQVDLEINLIGLPCWYPDTSARILFPGADGRLYRHDFDAAGGSDLEKPVPQPLTWSTRSWLAREALLRDPCWPGDSRFADTILVSLQFKAPDTLAPAPPSEIWWLRLDAAGESITAAGRVTPAPAAGEAIRSECNPTVVALPGAGALLAYLSLDPDGTWMLNVAPLRFDRRTGAPQAADGASRVVGQDARPDPPVFSPDGRWVSCVLGTSEAGPTALRVSIRDLGLEPPAGDSPTLAAHPPGPSAAVP